MIARRFTQYVSNTAIFLALVFGHSVLGEERTPSEKRIVRADIVALDQLLVYNRFGSYNPFGMIFALGRDVRSRETKVDAYTAALCADQMGTEGQEWNFDPENKHSAKPLITMIAGNARLRDCKRPRPLVIRGNVGDVLEIRLANLLLSHNHHGPYKHAKTATTTAEIAREKPGFSDTFCNSSSAKRRYGGDLDGLSNDEDTLRNASETSCRLAEHKDHIAKNPKTWNAPGPRTSDTPRLTAQADEADWPSTRHVSLVINGLTSLPDAGGKIDPACRGLGAVSTGAIVTCRWALDRDGTHFISSQAAVAGGEGDGGSLTHGLFGALIIEPEGAKAYRSQVTRKAFDEVWKPAPGKGQHARESRNIADYDRIDPRPEGAGRPVLNMHRKTAETAVVADEGETRPVYELVHADLNAIVDEPAEAGKRKAFREFTAILHDELKTFYTDNYLELSLFGHGQLAGARDGFAINYGASGMGTMLIANRKRIGPAADCVDCLYEESFLQSWVNGDPALLEHYPDDPSNVHHSYLNDRVVFRNFHAGPKETHIFHLHAHQWFAGNDRNRGSYLDSQTVGPQQGFSYRIYGGGQGEYGLPKNAAGLKDALGAGNANRTPGDSIFHCHLYPHFAQGMWALWRNHDVLEDGTRLLPDGQDHAGLSTDVREAAKAGERLASRGGTFLKSGRNLLGKEVAPVADDFLTEAPQRSEIRGGGTPVPAIVPLPGIEPPPLPTYGEDGMPGYPFYIPGQAGRRAPQAPMDIARKLDKTDQHKPVLTDEALDGGLPRHVVESGLRAFDAAKDHKEEEKHAAPAAMAATATETLARSLALANFGAHLKSAKVKLLPYDGTALERRAMAFHHNGLLPNGMPLAMKDTKGDPVNYDPATGSYSGFAVNGGAPRPGAPFADPCALPDAVKYVSAERWPNGRFATDRTISPVVDLLTARTAAGGTRPDLMPDPGLIGFRRYEVSAIQLRLVVNRAGWHDPQSRVNMLSEASDHYKGSTRGDVEPFFFRAHSGECIEFRHTNELPKDLARDDFQVKTPTDTIGQHIHLVKFDVMAADGSANGWNYEDGTFAPDEVHHRICAAIKGGSDGNAAWSYQAPALRLFGRACKVADLSPDRRDREYRAGKTQDDIPDLKIHEEKRAEKPQWFQTTVQRWFADPLLTNTGRKEVATQKDEMRDRTLRTVFTHDHFGPSSIQQHGFYSALVIEPPQTMICDVKGGACVDETASAYVAGAQPYYFAGGPNQVGARKLVLANATKVAQERDAVAKVLKDEIVEQQKILDHPDASEPSKQAALKAKVEAEAHLKDIAGGSAIFLQDLNMREYALAIADFALLYDPFGKRPKAEFYQSGTSTDPGDGRSGAKGLDCLIVEARIKVGGTKKTTLSEGCDPAHTGGMKALVDGGNVPPAHLATLSKDDAKRLAEETHADIRQKYGYPVSPPQRPEAISVDHHDPYLVNYRNEAIPLRVGTSSDKGESQHRMSCAELNAVNTQTFDAKILAGTNPANQRSIDRQRADASGDMSNVFRSTYEKEEMPPVRVLHSDPCTPIIEAYDGERLQIRLIQGAQEVQHAFTLEGYSFPRNIDQRLPSKSLLPPHYSDWLNADKTRQRECFESSLNLPLVDVLGRLQGRELSKLTFLRANCDNLDGRIAAQEIGISEHFEFASAFNADGQTEVRVERALRQQSNRSMTPKGDAARAFNRKSGTPAGARNEAEQLILSSIGGDSLYHFGTQDSLWNGAWGLLRIARNTASVLKGIPAYIDHTDCLAKSSPGTGGVYSCMGDLQLRLPQLSRIAEAARTAAIRARESGVAVEHPIEVTPAAEEPMAAQEVVQSAANFTIDCPVDNATDTVNIAAIRHGLLKYSGKLHDFDALRLVPDDGTGTQTAEQLARTPKGPLVVHMQAGRCLRLKVRNLLPEPLPGHDGDARMPGITSLNVNYGEWDKHAGTYKAGDKTKDNFRLRHSSRLALSIPLTTTTARSSFPAPFGVNFTGAAFPGETQTLTYYAGTMAVSWQRFEARVKNAEPSGPGPALPAACAPIQISNLRDGFAEQADIGLDLLGKRYKATLVWLGPGAQPATSDALDRIVRACLHALIAETKSPEPYASGAVPIKSFGDVIGHTAHGLIGAIVVLPASARVRHESRTDFPLDCGPESLTASATTAVTARVCLPRSVLLSSTVEGFDAGKQLTLKRSVVSEHALFWQDGLNLRDKAKTPVADCLTCDDSYDFGKRAVSYSTGMLAERLGKAAKSNKPGVHGAFDLNKVRIAEDIYVPGKDSKTLHLPPLFSRAGDEVRFRLMHPGGRARQRAFVMTGAGYEDLFPSFGFPSAALLAPGKAVTATLLRPARDKECNFWRDGPSYMVGQGVWGLHAVGGATDDAEAICREAAK